MIALTYLLVIYVVLATVFSALMLVADRADARRRRSNPVHVITALPLATAIPTKWRKSRWL